MNRFLSLAFFFMVATVSWAAKPTVANVSVEQDASGKIVVSYDLVADADSPEPGIVTVDFACGGEPVGAENYTYVWGDVNRKIACGTGKRVRWDAARDWAGHSAASNGALTASVKVWATNAPPMYMDLSLVVTNSVFYYASAEAVPFGITAEVYKTDRLLMRRIPAKGVVFRMGSPSSEEGRDANWEKPYYATFSSDYYIGVYPVTQRQHLNLCKMSGVTSSWESPSYFSAARGFADADLRPVEGMSYNKLRGEDNNAETTGDEEYLWPQKDHAVSPTCVLGRLRARTGIEFDLPTEAQWEYACRAGTAGSVNVEGATLDDVAWHPGNCAVDGVPQTHPVGLKLPNAFGLYDMLGNVLEWCLDNRRAYPVAADPKNPISDYGGSDAASAGNVRVRRGGSYGYVNTDGAAIGFDCRSAARWIVYSVMCGDRNLGYRLCCPAGDAVVSE